MTNDLIKVAEFHPCQIVTYVQGIDVYKQMRDQYQSIAKLKKEHGERPVAEGITYLIGYLQQMLNVGKNINSFQIAEIADSILQKNVTMTLFDIRKCFQKALTGEYGKVFDRLDIMIVHEFLNLEQESIFREAEQEQLKKINEHKKPVEIEPTVRERFQEIAKKLRARINEIQPEPYTYHKNIKDLLRATGLSDAEFQQVFPYKVDYLVSEKDWYQYFANRIVHDFNKKRIEPTKENFYKVASEY